jgi:hypothetical protein
MILDPERVFPNQIVLHLFDGCDHCGGSAFDDGLTPSSHPFVRGDLQKDPARRDLE